MVVKSRIVEV